MGQDIDTEAPHDGAEHAVREAEVAALFRQPLTAVPGGELVGSAAAIFAGVISNSGALLITGAVLILCGAVRFCLQLRFASLPNPFARASSVRRWEWLYLAPSFTSCGSVGIVGGLCALSGDSGVQMLGTAVVMGATATMGRSGTPPRITIVQSFLALAPSAFAWAWLAEPVTLALAAFIVPYFALQWRIGSDLHRLTHNALLSAELGRTLTMRLEEKNSTLELQDAQLRAQAVRFDAALGNMAQGLAMFDRELNLLVCNRRYTDTYGFDPEVVKAGITLRGITEHYVALGNLAGADPEAFYERERQQLSRDEALKFTRTLADGRKVQVNYRPMIGGGYVVTTEDVTEQLRAADRIAHLASHDPLTNLVNRSELPQRLGDALDEAAKEKGRQVAVLCLDLDGFKGVNDTLGHPAGDTLLQAVSGRLRNLVRSGDTVARLGGDEFVCVLSGLKTREAVAECAQRIVAALSTPYDLGGHEVAIGASVGIAIAPVDGADPETLLRHADVALYRAKTEGKGTFVFFGPDMERLIRERRELEADLRSGIARAEFELHYQPLVDMDSRAVIGCEALMRWQHPTRGLVMPNDFIPIAEDNGTIVQLGDWALRTACRDAASWPTPIRVAVNVSPLQFRNNSLVGTVISALAQSGLEPDRLELEITEAVLLKDSEETLATLTKLRALGVRIVMDDFGTGYSSLSYLRAFPFDKIKIDRSFVKECESRDDNRAIIRAVTDLANGLGISTTIEGVETEEQLKAVRSRGCSEAQGYLFGKAIPPAELMAALMAAQRKAA